MTGEDVIERVSPTGLVVRVSARRGTFLAFRGEKALSVARAGGETQIHYLPQVIFLGDTFDFTAHQIDRIDFFQVTRGFMLIPVTMRERSDVRHIRVPAVLPDADLLPAYVFRFRSYWPGPLPPLGGGSRYFIGEEKIDRMAIMRLKGKFPRARVIIFRPDEMKARKLELSPALAALANKRATDYVMNEEIEIMAQNPVFAARVYLRRLDWRSMLLLPRYGVFSLEVLNDIIDFMNKMMTKIATDAQLAMEQRELQETYDYYNGLRLVFNLEMKPVRDWYEAHELSGRQILQNLVVAAENQMRKLESQNDRKRVSFFKDAIRTLKNIPFEGYDGV